MVESPIICNRHVKRTEEQASHWEMLPSAKRWGFLGLPVAWSLPSSSLCHQDKQALGGGLRQAPMYFGTRSQKLLVWHGLSGAFPYGWPWAGKGQQGRLDFVLGHLPLHSSLPSPSRQQPASLPAGSSAFYDTQGPGPGSHYFVCYLHRWAVFFLDSAVLILGFSMMLSITLSATQDAPVQAKCQQKVRKEISRNLKLITLPRS